MTDRQKSPRQAPVASLRCTAGMAGLLTTLLLMTGCTATNQEPVLDVIEQRDVVVNLVIDTTEQLDVDGWAAHQGVASAQGCTLDNGADGAAYHFDLWAPPGTDYQTDVARIVEYWESLGMETRVVDHGEYPTVYATGGPVLRAGFTTNAAGDTYRIGAVAYCAPGNSRDLKMEYIERRKMANASPAMSMSPKRISTTSTKTSS